MSRWPKWAVLGLALGMACMSGERSIEAAPVNVQGGAGDGRGDSVGAVVAPWIRAGEQAESGYGTVLGGGGDLNGDGLGDLLVGEPDFAVGTQSSVGRVLIFLGSPQGFRSEPDRVLRGPEPGARFGAQVAILGDVNGDGLDDVGIGTPSFRGDLLEQGRVDVYFGSPTGIGTQPDWSRLGGVQAMQLGWIHRAGDVNGDGFDDVMVAGSDGGRQPPGAGVALLFLGSRTGLGADAVWARHGTQKNEWYGRQVAAVPDLNGDGYGEILLGAILQDARMEDEGRVELFYGTAGGLDPGPAWTSGPVEAGGVPQASGQRPRFGSALASAGDVNGDGVPDVAIGAPDFGYEDEREGHVWVWHGARAGLGRRADWVVEGNRVNGHFGTGVAGVGDVNGDGFDDLVVTGPTLSHGELNEGVVALYLGSTHGLSRWPHWTAESNETGAELGGTVVGLGDANGDGLADFAVGCRHASRLGTGPAVGEVRVYWGRRGAWVGGSGWSPRLSGVETLRRRVDRLLGEVGLWWVAGLLLALLMGGMTVARLVSDRRRARLEIETLRNRLHDYVGSELAGTGPPDPRLRGWVDELKATIWTLKQDAPTVHGLVGYLSDWAWRFAREKDVRLRLELPRDSVRHRGVDIEVAEFFQAVVRTAFTDAVGGAGARAVRLAVAVGKHELTVEVRDDRSRSPAPAGKAWEVEAWASLSKRAERCGGRLEVSLAGEDGGVVRAACPFKVREGWGRNEWALRRSPAMESAE